MPTYFPAEPLVFHEWTSTAVRDADWPTPPDGLVGFNAETGTLQRYRRNRNGIALPEADRRWEDLVLSFDNMSADDIIGWQENEQAWRRLGAINANQHGHLGTDLHTDLVWDAWVDAGQVAPIQPATQLFANIADAIAAGAISIFVTEAGDTAAITIAQGDAVQRFVGKDPDTTLLPASVSTGWPAATARSSANTAKCICRAIPSHSRTAPTSIWRSATSSRAIWASRSGAVSAASWACASATTGAGPRPTG